MDISRERICYNALLLVYRDGAYSSIALSEVLKDAEGETEFITRLFYGVLEKNITLEYIIDKLTTKRPKSAGLVILKMGIYMLRYMSVADYAVVDRCVELAKVLGKGGTSGFINAVLRKANSVELPKEGERDYLSVNFGLPEWLCEALVGQYGEVFVKDMMSASEPRTHIRLKSSVDVARFEKELQKHTDLSQSKTKYGYYVTHSTLNALILSGVLRKNDYAVQSLASASATHCYARGLSEEGKALDLCAAPGGKAVYLKELTSADVTACDIHEHRLGLIRSYAKRMGVNVTVMNNDACVERAEWLNAFDCVICDVPCSGSGDLRSRPDILLNRTESGVVELSKLQSRILRQAAKYVKAGGRLCYSTCSILQTENENVVESFLKHNADFSCEDCSDRADGKPYLRLFPHTHGTDGFFVAVMRRSEEDKT